IESSYGLGEAIVLGKVTPDRFVLDKHTLHVVERVLSAKDVVISTVTRDGRGPAAGRDGASLNDAQLTELAKLGQRVEAYFGVPDRALGDQPDRSLDAAGVYDLVCGRSYCNRSREPRLYARGQPLEHSFAALKAAPHQALYPQARPNRSKAGWTYWLSQPVQI